MIYLFYFTDVMFIIFNGNLYNHIIGDLTKFQVFQNDTEVSIRLVILHKPKEKANLGQVVEQKLKTSIYLFTTI